MARGLPPLEWGTLVLDGSGEGTVETKFQSIESVVTSHQYTGEIIVSVSGSTILFSGGTIGGIIRWMAAGKQ